MNNEIMGIHKSNNLMRVLNINKREENIKIIPFLNSGFGG